MDYRVEQKYLVTEDTIVYLQKQLESCMKYDSNGNSSGYLIRSLYFDDMYDSCFYENESGVDQRKKYRIRCYNRDFSFLRLECKEKKRGFTRKQGEKISYEDCLSYMSGRLPDTFPSEGGVGRNLYVNYLCARMLPACIVEYERIAMIEPMGNVRITFDRNIGGTEKTDRFFMEQTHAVPVLPAGMHILEIKYDEFLPPYLNSLIKECSLKRTAFSKYYYVRLAQNGQLFRTI